MGHLDCAKWLVDVAGLQVASIEDWCHRTPFYAACETGNIECAKWLIEIGGTSDIRKPSFNTTPMAAACERGELSVLKWLTNICGSEDLRLRTTSGDTLLHLACINEHHNVAKWLFEAGLVDYLHIENVYNMTPFMLAFPRDESQDLTLALWLCEVGAAHDNVTHTLDLKRFPLHAHETFYSNVQRRIHNFSAINILLLQSQIGHRSLTPSLDRDTTSAHLQVHTPASLQSFEFALIKMIADFIDVPIPYGKPLRRLREIHDALFSLVYSSTYIDSHAEHI